jgi:hypothetical protein
MMSVNRFEGEDTRNLLANAVRLTGTLPAGKVKLDLLCKCAIRLGEYGELNEGRKLFDEAHRMLDDIPVDPGRKYLLHELVLTSATLLDFDKGKKLAAELEELFDSESRSPFRDMTAGLVAKAWARLGCFHEITIFLNKLSSELRTKSVEVAVLEAASVGHWPEICELLKKNDMSRRITEVAAELLVRLSRSDLPRNEREAIMSRILEVSETAV